MPIIFQRTQTVYPLKCIALKWIILVCVLRKIMHLFPNKNTNILFIFTSLKWGEGLNFSVERKKLQKHRNSAILDLKFTS